MFGKKTKQELEKEDRAVSDLIEEQKLKESGETYRRAWCIQQAALVVDETDAAGLIRMAKEIYQYVYRNVPPEQ